jgi:hypothetical protein
LISLLEELEMRTIPMTLATASLIAGSAFAAPPAQAATTYHRVGLTTSMTIYDDDGWLAGYTKAVVNKSEVRLLPSDMAVAYAHVEGCAGDEVRIEVDPELALLDDGTLKVSGTAELWEGASCDNSDLDGSTAFTFYVPKGSARGNSFTIRNTDEGGDYATVRLTATNIPSSV